MSNEYNGRKVILRDTNGNQMSLPRFFQLGLVGPNGEGTYPTQGYPNHYAWDIGCNGLIGVIPARCPVSGEVALAQISDSAGKWVIVKEDTNGAFDRWHIFMHLDSFSVAVGDLVSQGTEVGKIGNTGNSSGSHLHYQIAIENPQSVSRVSENPIDVFDESTLPAGWNMEDAASARNWNYIPLDTSATDYGPPSEVTAAEPFFTEGYCYDISHHQSTEEVRELVNDSRTGGIIIRIGQTPDYRDPKAGEYLALCKQSNVPVGFYFFFNSCKDYLGSWDAVENVFKTCFDWMADLGISSATPKLGVWLDMEDSLHAWCENAEDNVETIRRFNKIGMSLGYPIVGFYTTKGAIESRFRTDTGLTDYPFWYSRPGKSRTTVTHEISNWGFSYAYLWQDGMPADGGHGDEWSPSKTYLHKNVDNDTLLKAIPSTSGSSSSTGYTQSGGSITIDVDVISPKRIYFSPNPGIIDGSTDLISRSETISISTDAENSVIYFTANGSSPYVYVKTEEEISYQLSRDAILYEKPLEIYSDTHLRVIAVPEGTEDTFSEILAKGSGTFLFRQEVSLYSWDDERISYNLQSPDKRINYFEENKQAFLRFHPEETDEEVLYNAVFTSTYESKAEEQDSSGSESGGVS